MSHNLYFEKFFAVFAQKIRPRQGGSEKRSVFQFWAAARMGALFWARRLPASARRDLS